MRTARSATGLLGLVMLLSVPSAAVAQWAPEVRRARPVEEPPVARAIPFEEPAATTPRPPAEDFSERQPARENEAPDRRQLDYANALFTRKLYDLAIPEYQKYLEDRKSTRLNSSHRTISY